ncbi:Ig-like domain repeat protein [Methanobrevibacter sp.]|uniref:pseudomurein-binding repeat-containing protein n=1 Tax=Methanobrevibacter sp. TaxID=66852 RepID=UPI0026DEA214|nr:Ig-like domain repeat protein [Methanobrevibacter sp.]MDO5823236.1 pseudomurein-binding repeat-containing protein [Methanobrevibacter sp.]
MNKQMLLALLVAMAAVLSAGAVSAGDVNVTDSYSANLLDNSSDISTQIDDDADSSVSSASEGTNVDNDLSVGEGVLESGESNNLSTNAENNSLSDGADEDDSSNLENNSSQTIDASNTVTSKDLTKYYKGSNQYYATFLDKYGNPLVNSEVNITVNGVTYTRMTDEFGVAFLEINLYPGLYNITSENPITGFKLINVIKVLSTVSSKDLTKYYKGSNQYQATFLDGNGNPLANTNVKISVNGVTYTKKTNSKGVASLTINLNPGTYTITSQDPVSGYKLKNTIKVLSTITASDISKVYTDGRLFYATFLNSEGKPLTNKNVKFKINGKTYTKKTNGKGVASLSMTSLKTGTYKIISYNVDGLTKTNTVKVISKTSSKLISSSYTFFESDKKVIKVTLHNGLGYAPGSGKVIKFTINGKTYSAKSNSAGVASLTLPYLKEGTYTVKYSFAGNIFYTASSASNKVYIFSSKTPKFTVKSGTTFGKGADLPFKVALTSGNTPLAKKTVIFTVNGVSYTKTTDEKGIVSLPIGLNPGKYTITYKFNGDSIFNAKTGSSTITTKERVPVNLVWKSGNSFSQGAQTYKILLQDNSGKALGGKVIKLTVNSKTYQATTASNGYATFNVNLAAGNYSVSLNYLATGDNDYAPSSGKVNISVDKKPNDAYGYWVYGQDMKSVSLNNLASQGTTDLFLNFKAIETHGQSVVESWIDNAKKLGMRVHIWMQVFMEGGTWTNPVKDGKPNTAFFEKKITEAQKYAKIKGIAGVHLDYLRYPGNANETVGGTEAINTFVKDIVGAIHNIDSNIIVSCALMPETTSSAYYYGQDYSVISKYMDVVVPMIYKGNYGKTSAWITTTAKWYIDNSKGAQVWAGIQGYVSDSNPTKLSASAIKTDAQAAFNSKAPGIIIFRWGTTNFVDFNSLSQTSSSVSGYVSIEEIIATAINLKNTIDSKKEIPKTVTVAGVSYSISQFLYLMSEAVKQINAGKASSQIKPVSSGNPADPSGSFKGTLTTAQYVDVAKRVSSYIVSNGRAPNYASLGNSEIKYESLIELFAKVLADYYDNQKLPSSESVGVSTNTNTNPQPITKTISVKNIVLGASNLKSYYEKNKVLPSTVTVAGIKFSLHDFMYLMSQAIYQLGNSNTKDITIVEGISAPSNPSGDTIKSKDLDKANFIKVAQNTASYMKTNKKAPNYSGSAVGNIIYSELVDAFSRILAFYSTNNRLPNTVTISHSASGSSSESGVGATGTGLNEKNTIKDLTAYLKASTNCQVNNAKIKALVDSLTKGLTSDEAKAKKIFEYVRDTLSYSFYYNTKYGAVGTLNAKAGNCVDHSHLLVAMYRNAGLAARYVHGTCKFTSGSTYGHVWVQVLVGDTWRVVDATSSRNSFGKVANWNTNSFTLKGIYSSLSF